MRKILLQTGVMLAVLLQAGVAAAQSDVALATRKAELKSLSASLKQRDATDRVQAGEFARRLGIPMRRELTDGRILELQRIAPGIGPVFYITNNVDAADTVSTDEVWPGGSAGLLLDGNGMVIGEWDGGAVYAAHTDLIGRVTQVDGATAVSGHSTHVAGTLIGAGLNPFYPQARGMAYAAHLDAYDWISDTAEMALAASNGMLVSNHSYGIAAGWLYIGDVPPDTWWWIGGADPGDVEDANFGYYDSEAQLWDQIAHAAPYYLIVKAAGNDRWDTGPLPGEEYSVIDQDGEFLFTSTLPRNFDCAPAGYDCLPGHSVAKNILTVGAVDDLFEGYASLAGPSQVQMGGFSGWGPTDDGRIKPDLVGNGLWLVSTWPEQPYFAAALGTSMATPNVTGSLLLLQEHYENLNGSGNYMRAATLKALAIHTADEAGDSDGPDYEFGWGLLNTKTAAQVISEDGGDHQIIEDTLASGGIDTIAVSVTQPNSIIRATLAWTDPPGTPAAPTLDPTDLMLVNDLDLRIKQGPSTWLPWRLNPASPAAAATRADNFRDNVEQVAAEVTSTGSYTVEVSNKGTLLNSDPQDYSLVISVAPAPSTDISQLINEDFSGGMPSGWSVNTVRGDSWTVNAPVPGHQFLDNKTGGSGNFAIVNNQFTNTITSLVLPVLDLSSATGVILRFDSNFRFSDLESINVDVSSNGGSTWTNVWQKLGLIGFPAHYDLDLTGQLAGQSSSVVRFRYHTNNESAGYYWQVDNVQLEALGLGPPPPPGEAPNPAESPFPAGGETGLDIDTTLNWSPGEGATSHNVYFGTSTPPPMLGNLGGTGYDPGTLDYDTTYHWRIDEVNSAGTTPGTDWSFTTMEAPEPPPPPPPPPEVTDIHLASLSGLSIPGSRGRWNASVLVEVLTDAGAPASGVLVEGDWSNGATGSVSCDTDSNGKCAVEKSNLKSNVISVDFTITTLSGADMNYDSVANVVSTLVSVLQDGGGGNLLPDAIADSFTTAVDTPVNGNVMANDSQGDAPASVTAFDSTTTQLGTVTMNTAGDFTYTPPAGFSGPDSFAYTIQDNDGDSDSATVSVTINPASGGGLSLTVTSSRNKGNSYAGLAWSGGNSTGNVAIERNGELVAPSTPNDGSWSENLGKGVSGSYTYRVCENTIGGTCAEDTIQF